MKMKIFIPVIITKTKYTVCFNPLTVSEMRKYSVRSERKKN